MKMYSIFNNINSQLPLSVSILELYNTDDWAKGDFISVATHFEILKRYHFNFRAEKVGDIVPTQDYIPTVNYSNYDLDKIGLDDFRHISSDCYVKIVADELAAWAKTYDAINQEELDWLIKTTNNQIEKVAAKYTDCYCFDLPANAAHEKRHPHFTLYEFFLSFIFYGNRDDMNVVGYVLLAYG